MSGHTPGPWMSNVVFTMIVNSTGKRIAALVGDTEEDDEANARLIAAAPEMLEALKAAEAFLTGASPNAEWRQELIAELKRVRLVAEGREP